jgi:hypothetical protein
MRASALVVAVGLAGALAGCLGRDEEVENPEAGQDTTATTASAVSAATDTGIASMTRTTLDLRPAGGSALTGNATLEPSGAHTRVVVEVAGSQAGAVHQGQVHAGTCEALGASVAPLLPVTVDARGNGTSATTIAVAIVDLTDAPHAVSFHQAGGNPGPPVVCGDIPRSRI